MHVSRIQIKSWRQFKDFTITVPDNAKVVCLVGENGTGKTALLELISAAGFHIGVSSGVPGHRGDAFSESHEIEIDVQVHQAVVDYARIVEANVKPSTMTMATWDGRLRFRSRVIDGKPDRLLHFGVMGGGWASNPFLTDFPQYLRSQRTLNQLFLDADRSYTPILFESHLMDQFTRSRWNQQNAVRSSATQAVKDLYSEWIYYCINQENKAGRALFKEQQEAKRSNRAPSELPDPFHNYRLTIRKILPHLEYHGYDEDRMTVMFASSGKLVPFTSLSSGEKELAFLTGQIDRFALREGLLLIDEPELHLNPDLVRVWLGFIAESVQSGQVWLATHSIEAAEAAGTSSTFILSRDSSGVVRSAVPIKENEFATALAKSLGTPAFSISKLRFVFTEGENRLGEAERFSRLCGRPADTRFLPCGNCTEVCRRLASSLSLSTHAPTGIRAGGVIDADARSHEANSRLRALAPAYALDVHEVENFFLHPATLQDVLTNNGFTSDTAMTLIENACDDSAGRWVADFAVQSNESAADWAYKYSAEFASLKAALATASFADLTLTPSPIDTAHTHASSLAGGASEMKKFLLQARSEYKRARDSGTLWKRCQGKEVLKAVAARGPIRDPDDLANAMFAAWERGLSIPAELQSLRAYVRGL